MAITKIPAAGFSDAVNFRNIIINGDMSIAQRATSATGKTSNGYYTVDRFQAVITSQGTWTHAQSTDVPTGQGFAKSLKIDCTTADASPAASDKLQLRQKIEGQNLQYLKKGTSSAESLTLSFWVRSNKTGTYIAEIFDTDNSRQISQSYTISSADTWEKKTLTFAGDTTGTLNNDNGDSFECVFWLGAGSNFTSGTLSTTWTSNTDANRAVGQVNLADSTSNEWYITGIQLEAGTSASEFEFLPFDVNYQKCMRYYETSQPYGTRGFTTTAGYMSGDTRTNVTTQIDGFNYRVEKRASPTTTIYRIVDGASGRVYRTNDAGNPTVVVTNAGAVSVGYLYLDGGGNINLYKWHYEAESEL